MTSPTLIRTLGEAMYGRQFQSALAEALHVNRRTIHRWLSGADEPQQAKWVALFNLAQQRTINLQTLASELWKRF